MAATEIVYNIPLDQATYLVVNTTKGGFDIVHRTVLVMLDTDVDVKFNKGSSMHRLLMDGEPMFASDVDLLKQTSKFFAEHLSARWVLLRHSIDARKPVHEYDTKIEAWAE